MRHIGHMGLNAPASQRRGKSVSDGFSRTSLRVFAVNTLAVLAIRRRSLTEHGYVPVRSSEQDCATRENPPGSVAA